MISERIDYEKKSNSYSAWNNGILHVPVSCGKNEAKEAANESAQVEEEGVGEVTEEGKK